jgi:AraC-like DNA-binding protein
MTGFTLTSVKNEVVRHSPLFTSGAPDRFTVDFNIDPDLGVMNMDMVQNRYFGVGDMRAEFKHDVVLTPFQRPAHFGLAVMNGPKGTVKFNHGKWIDVMRGQTYLTFNPGVEEVHHFLASKPMNSIFLEIKPGYFNNLLMEQEPKKGTRLYDVRERVIRGEFAGAGADIFSPAFYNTLLAMFNCPLSGNLGNLMLEGGLQQLLALQFGMLGNEAVVPKAINNRDRDVMTAVKEHLDGTFNEDHSLLALSKKFGINQNKLKTQFRELFRVPVIGYLFDLKMEHARTLLLDKGMFVSEVAHIVGYRNANHFATAFKRKFGVNPSKLKR